MPFEQVFSHEIIDHRKNSTNYELRTHNWRFWCHGFTLIELLVARHPKSGFAGRRKAILPAFTLIELLVVIAILGILASVTIASYGGTQERARDSRRKTDLDALKKALELAKQNTVGAYYYPGCATSPCGASQTVPALAPTYIKTVPKDPKTNLDYTYTPTACTGTNCTTYSLVACLENTNDPAKDTAQNETACPGSPVSYTITPY